MIKTTLAKLLTVKVATAAIVFTGMGGVALAAGTGALSDETKGKSDTVHGKADDSKGEGSGKPEKATSKKDKSDKAKDKKATPSPSMVGLCKAYAAHDKSEHGKALESTAFTALIKAAGSKSNVPAYCTLVLAAKDSKTGADNRPDAAGETGKNGENGKADTVKDKPRPEEGDDKPEPTRTPAPRLTTK